MLTFKDMQKYVSPKTIGEYMKVQSDDMMEWTWDNNIQAKKMYIYDYYHDDSPEKNYGFTYEHTTKTPVEAKFIIAEYGSLSKDQPSAKIMFKPSMKTWGLDENDELYYLQKRADFYGIDNIFVGAYIDIPDEKGVYRKWMICLQDIQGNQFPKYFVLPCGYNLNWIRRDGNKRVKQKMWCVLRSQSS